VQEQCTLGIATEFWPEEKPALPVEIPLEAKPFDFDFAELEWVG